VDGRRRFDLKDWKVAPTTQLGRTRLALRAAFIAVFFALALASGASADPTGATGAAPSAVTGTVTQLGADPTVSIAKRRHCVTTKAIFAPVYTGGGGVRRTYLYINGELVAQRWSSGTLRISAKHLERGANSFELISEFQDGRAASKLGAIRRCR
jgi:hypothetical protein